MDFGKLASQWWDPYGPMRPLHELGPQRTSYIKSQLQGGLAGKTVLDVGCGAGLVCEPLARLGALVTGIDQAPELIEAAKTHAATQNLAITYARQDVADVQDTFDVVLVLEVVEHVSDPGLLIAQAAARLKPGGAMILSTLNRTPKSFLLGKLAAEYVLRWVPAGTHDWKMFLKPHELVAHAESAGLKAADLCGLVYDPLRKTFKLDKTDLSINYFLTCTKES